MTARRIVVPFLSLLALAATPRLAEAQESPRAEVEVHAVLLRMFEGMRTADSAMVRSTLAPGARFAVLDARATPPAIRYDSPDRWLAGIANSAKRWDERLYETQIRVDGNVAQAWTGYTFYLDGQKRHCGVDAIELLRDADGWKVTQLSDTQRREGCRDVPSRGAPAGESAEKVYFEFQVEKPVATSPGSVMPAYPAELKTARVEGEVLAQFVVGTDGLAKPETLKILKSSHGMLSDAVRAALPQMRFSPAEIGGRKVPQLVQQPFTFALNR